MRNGKTTYRKGGGGEKERRGSRIDKTRRRGEYCRTQNLRRARREESKQNYCWWRQKRRWELKKENTIEKEKKGSLKEGGNPNENRRCGGKTFDVVLKYCIYSQACCRTGVSTDAVTSPPSPPPISQLIREYFM